MRSHDLGDTCYAHAARPRTPTIGKSKMKAYSLDFRKKIIDVYNEGNISQRQLAKQFRVALSNIEEVLDVSVADLLSDAT